MENLETVLHRITGSEILLRLRVFLCQNSASFAEQQAAFYAAAAILEKVGIAKFGQWLNACEANVTAAVITAAILGFRNEEMPASEEAATLPTREGMLSEDLRRHIQTIREYYERLKADGILIAHLAGCLTACALLPWVQPECTPNERQVLAYALTAEASLGYMPFEESVSELLKKVHPNQP